MFVLTGCIPHYNLVPDYDKENKILRIDTISIETVVYYQEKTKSNDTNSDLFLKRENFKTNDEQCSNIFVLQYQTDKSWYYHNSMKSDILNKYAGKCTVEKIANLYFLECSKGAIIDAEGELKKERSTKYHITTSTSKEYGYGSKINITGLSRTCFNRIKSHFSSMTDPKYIKKDNSYFEKFEIKKFVGSLKALPGTPCFQTGNIALTIENNIVEGYIKITRKGQTIEPPLKGKVVDNDFFGKTHKHKFEGEIINNSYIKGEYFNKRCRGTFELKLE